jgi:oligoendopeptidase F
MSKTTGKKKYEWDLSLLYKSPTDPQIEKDLITFESLVDLFVKKYNKPNIDELISNDVLLLQSLKDYEEIIGDPISRAILYFHYASDLDASNTTMSAQLALLQNRLTMISNKLTFFIVNLGKIDTQRQTKILDNINFAHFRIFLERIFADAKHVLSVSEENIMSIKSLPAYDMWVHANEKILHQRTVKWKGKELPGSAAMQLIANLKTQTERKKLATLVNNELKSVAPFAEAEINAVFTNKKIDDELRKFNSPFESTVLGYRNDPNVVEQLRKTVMDQVSIAHKFYKLKAKILGLKKLGYYDRAAKIGVTKSKYSFDTTVSKLKETFGKINPKYSEIIDSYIKNGQIDVFPRVGKTSGAYCSSSSNNPTFVLLNHTDDLHSFTTAAHELGHAFHGEFSEEKQSPLYVDYSISLAETASTLFESIASKAVYNSLSDEEKIVVLHDRINDDVSTIFRQIACFNFELDLHTAIRSKGYLSKEEIADLHNKNMSSYLGPVFRLEKDDGYFFVTWSHIRRFFYVYTYAYGMLVSKALLRRYKKDPTFWKHIEQFLSAGGKDSPENILMEIGIDVSSPEFFKEGLMEIADDIKELEKLTKKVITNRKMK